MWRVFLAGMLNANPLRKGLLPQIRIRVGPKLNPHVGVLSNEIPTPPNTRDGPDGEWGGGTE